MSGRAEGNDKIHASVQKKLQNAPDYLIGFYYSMAGSQEASSCMTYVSHVKDFLAFINTDVNKVTVQDITRQNYDRYMFSKNKCSNSHRYGLYCAINRFLKYLVAESLIDANFLENVERPKSRDPLPTLQVHQKEMIAMMDSIKSGTGSHRAKARQERMRDRDLSIALIFAYTGMRVTALTQIDLDDIDFEKKKIKIIDKGGKHHEYFLDDLVINQILKWIPERDKYVKPGVNALFVSNRGTRIASETVASMTKKYANVSPHKLRAGFATILHDQGVDVRDIKEAGGWSRIDTVSRYIRDGEEAKRKAVATMGNVYKEIT